MIENFFLRFSFMETTMSLDIHGRHQEVYNKCPLPNVLVSIVIAYLGNELVAAKRTRITRTSRIINIIDDDIYYQENDSLYINDTNTQLRIDGYIISVSKISNTGLLINYEAMNNMIYNVETNEQKSVPGMTAVVFKGNVYYRSWTDVLFKLNENSICTDVNNENLISAIVKNVKYRAGCMIVSRTYKCICASDERWYAARDGTYSIHIYNSEPHYVHRDMLFSVGFQYEMDGPVLFAQQCGHCVYVSTATSGYVWDLRHQTVYVLNERIQAQEAGEQRFARVNEEWVDHFF